MYIVENYIVSFKTFTKHVISCVILSIQVVIFKYILKVNLGFSKCIV